MVRAKIPPHIKTFVSESTSDTRRRSRTRPLQKRNQENFPPSPDAPLLNPRAPRATPRRIVHAAAVDHVSGSSLPAETQSASLSLLQSTHSPGRRSYRYSHWGASVGDVLNFAADPCVIAATPGVQRRISRFYPQITAQAAARVMYSDHYRLLAVRSLCLASSSHIFMVLSFFCRYHHDGCLSVEGRMSPIRSILWSADSSNAGLRLQ
ncbi:hypothetical protein B0T17DRAFT_232150 [Bombardia bombarda]|uniref:Uncharacterized protein n=1 Tax=Bombardia bombarda TaxID=252184 RepID=A0AA39XCP4_9PEZI|nr:hypothetical protein B0T17DRAFT_232150 [Bombardia bombarda]